MATPDPALTKWATTAADILNSELAKSARESMFKFMGGGAPLSDGEPICPECGNRVCMMSPDVARGLHPLMYCEPWAGIKAGCAWVGPLADCKRHVASESTEEPRA